MSRTPAIMLQGTGSDVGKSLIVAGLARAYTARGLRVRPFKPQNMSNNAAVAADGGEIGRAQALQARACRVPASRHMNPVLLKPQSEIGAQVILQGALAGSASAADYHRLKPTLLPKVLESFALQVAAADLVLVEGAGSPAEVNLRDGDIANMGFAAAADLPVALVGDIDRGGVIASLVGTCALLEPAERARLKGFIINKFRGDASLFGDGLRIITEHTGLRGLGVLPFFAAARELPAEDALGIDNYVTGDGGPGRPIRIVVPLLPRIANFDDLDPLRAEPDVALELLRPGRALPGDTDLVLLPGSKSTIADLAFLREQGWDVDIAAHVRRGGGVLGLCGGYQMLGRTIADPAGVEGPAGAVDGLGLLDIETTLFGDKQLREVAGTDCLGGAPVRGYEIHIGRSQGPATARPLLLLADGRADGAVAEGGRIAGCYLHGLFAADRFRHDFLARLRQRTPSGLCYEERIDQLLDRFADHVAVHLDLDRILEIAAGGAR